ncbi:MAG: DUF424 family protein [Candidatus Bilamarchaeaceae archaeon]
MYMKIHEVNNGRVVAACDKELIGKVFEKNGICIDLDTYKNFYMGDVVSEDRLLKELSDFSSANLVGKKVVSVALKAGLVLEKEVRYINSIPYIQIYKI